MWSDYSKAIAAVANIPTLTLIPLYAAPPQREWVGLTVTTILNMMPSTIPAEYDGGLMEFARAVEDKLKEKNT